MEKIDRRWIFGIMMAVFVMTILRPVGLAVTIDDSTTKVFETIDSLPPGSLIWIAAEYEPASSPELEPAMIAVARHAMKNDLRIVSADMWPTGGMMVDRVIKVLEKDFPDKKYGVDYVNLGYRPGEVVFLQQLTQDLPAAVNYVDHYGNDIRNLPIMNNIKSLKDFAVFIGFVGGNPGYREHIKIVTDPLDIPYIASVVAVSVPEAMTMVNSKQIDGIIKGLRGAAEYEKISQNPGTALTGMDTQSFINLVILVFIVLGNIGYLIKKSEGRK
jgi:hypothetical protein